MKQVTVYGTAYQARSDPLRWRIVVDGIGEWMQEDLPRAALKAEAEFLVADVLCLPDECVTVELQIRKDTI